MSKTSDLMRKEWKINDAKRDSGLTTPKDVDRTDNIRYGPDKIWNLMDLYRPKKKEGLLPVIVSVHGGGWVYGDKELYQFYCMSLAERGFGVINFTYRLAPENKFPAPLEDTNNVMIWLCQNADLYGLDLDKVCMVGDSAGAHLVSLYTAICTDNDYAANYSFTVPKEFHLNALGLNCGAYDLQESLDSKGDVQTKELMSDFLPIDTPEERDLITVTNHINKSFPPIYLVSCIGDFLLYQVDILRKKLDENNVYYEYKIYGTEDHPLYHVFHVTIQDPFGQQCNDDECNFFKRIIIKGKQKSY